jgi:hypothetical protein
MTTTVSRFILVMLSCTIYATAFTQISPFERSGGKATATYTEAIDWYRRLDASSSVLTLKTMGTTDAGYPLHVALLSADGSSDPAVWHRQKKAVILINNGIHPGEPDGIDASMLVARDIVAGKIKLPSEIALAIIPVYNIGGCLNRNRYSRANQNGPEEYGFRGNAQNLDLNRDFTKCDSREARSFAQLFHWLNPEILVDNHVSDGADYQYTMTMLTTQYDKLGKALGTYLKQSFEPMLYNAMEKEGEAMCPYVNFETTDFGKGMEQFYDPPRYSSGYAALFHTIGFVPETHMLKPFADRVKATYTFMKILITQTSLVAHTLVTVKQIQRDMDLAGKTFPLGWQLDTTTFSTINFKGYTHDSAISEATGLPRMLYNRQKPFEQSIRYYNQFTPVNTISKPKAYLVPQGWHAVTDLLKLNGVQLQPLLRDTFITVETYRIEDYKSYARPYEKHHKNYDVKCSTQRLSIRFLKGDWLITTQQPACRYLVEMLEPTGDDSFFAWNFFDAILQQKEGYSDYRWEEIAAEWVRQNPDLRRQLEAKKKTDPAFAQSSSAQLNFIYKNSPYYEPGHMRYPVCRIPND